MPFRFWSRKKAGGTDRALKLTAEELEAQAFVQRGDELLEATDYEGATRMYAEAIRCSPNNHELHYKRAFSSHYLHPPRCDLALQELKYVERLNKNYEPAIKLKADILAKRKKADAAEQARIKAANHFTGTAGTTLNEMEELPVNNQPPVDDDYGLTASASAMDESRKDSLEDVTTRTNAQAQ